MMINTRYEGLMGAVERQGPHSVQTLFYHFVGLPIWPQASYFVTKDGLFATPKVMELERNRRSILSGYVVQSLAVLAFYVLCVAIFFFATRAPIGLPPELDPMPFGFSIAAYLLVVASLGMAAVAAAAWFLLRSPLSADEKARRAIFAQIVGLPVDPAQLKDPWSLRADLQREVAAWAEAWGMGRGGYERWREILADERARDPRIVRVGLVLTRILMGHPEKGQDTAAIAQLHEVLWQRLSRG